MIYSNLIYGGVSVAFVFFIGFYISNRRRKSSQRDNENRKESTRNDDDGQKHDLRNKRQRNGKATSTTHSNGLRKRDVITDTTGDESKRDQEETPLLIQNLIQSPSTPRKSHSTIKTLKEDQEQTDKGSVAPKPIKITTGFVDNKTTNVEVNAQTDSTEFERPAAEVKDLQLTKVKENALTVEKHEFVNERDDEIVEEKNNKDVVKSDKEMDLDIEIAIADVRFQEDNSRDNVSFLLNRTPQLEAKRYFNINSKLVEEELNDINENRIKNVVEEELNFSTSRRAAKNENKQSYSAATQPGTVSQDLQTNIIDGNLHQSDENKPNNNSSSSLNYTEKALQQDGVITEDVDKSDNITKEIGRLRSPSKFKLFVFQKYSEKLSDRVMTRVSNAFQVLHDSRNDFADDLSLSILYQARKDFHTSSSTSSKTNDKTSMSLDKIADSIVDDLLLKVNEEMLRKHTQSTEKNDIGKDIDQAISNNKIQTQSVKELNLVEENESGCKVVVGEKHTIEIPSVELVEDETDGPTVIAGGYDRPLSGYAEKLAAFLADDDEFEEFNSDEDEDEDEDGDKENKNVTSNNRTSSQRNDVIEDDFDDVKEGSEFESDEEDSDESELELSIVDSNEDTVMNNEVSGKELITNPPELVNSFIENGEMDLERGERENRKKEDGNAYKKISPYAAPAKRRQNKNRRTRGERPKSLYEQDLMEVFHEIEQPDDEEEESKSDSEIVKPVSETVVLLENQIIAPKLRQIRAEESFSYDDDFSNNSSDLLGCQTSVKPTPDKRKFSRLFFYCPKIYHNCISAKVECKVYNIGNKIYKKHQKL